MHQRDRREQPHRPAVVPLGLVEEHPRRAALQVLHAEVPKDAAVPLQTLRLSPLEEKQNSLCTAEAKPPLQ